MRIKFISFIMFAAVFAVTVTAAQENNFIERRVQQLKEELKLSDEQSEKILNILLSEREQAQKDREEYKDDRSSLRDATAKSRKATEQKITAVLTEEQKTGYEEFKNKRSPAAVRTQLLVERLDLTDEQTEKVREIFEVSDKQMQEKRDSFSGDRREMFRVMREMREETDEKIEAQLTPEQKEEFEKHKEERRATMRGRMGGRGRGRR